MTRGAGLRRGAALFAIVLVMALLGAVGAGASVPRCDGEEATIVGTKAADVLRGTDGPDVIVAKGGDDKVVGRDGDDLICGGAGIDTLKGGGGNDTLLGGGLMDFLYGLAGDDVLEGGAALNTLDGGDGNDMLAGGPDGAWFVGGEGDDVITGGAAIDTLNFEPAAVGVTVDLAAGTAVGEGTDTLTGIEYVVGSEFDDTITGDDGDNLFFLLGGDDSLDGGGEAELGDVVMYEWSEAAVTVNLTTGTATGEGSDTLTGVEHVVGSTLDDTITGDASVNYLVGREGNDTLIGMAGDDGFVGGDGDETIDGGRGVDWVDFEDAPGPVTADLVAGTATGDGSDTLVGIEGMLGSQNDDTLTGDSADNTIMGRDGDDVLDGAAGTDTLDGGAGTDTCLNGEDLTDCEA